MGRSFDDGADPLALITAPPVSETPEQRRARERKEAEAKKISEQIDEALRIEREEGRAKRKHRLKVLLLGQSESGASVVSSFFSRLCEVARRRRYPCGPVASSSTASSGRLGLFLYANLKSPGGLYRPRSPPGASWTVSSPDPKERVDPRCCPVAGDYHRFVRFDLCGSFSGRLTFRSRANLGFGEALAPLGGSMPLLRRFQSFSRLSVVLKPPCAYAPLQRSSCASRQVDNSQK
jgi:hypothetical protein